MAQKEAEFLRVIVLGQWLQPEEVSPQLVESGAGSSLPRRELETEGVAFLDVYITKEWFPVLSFK